MSVVLGLPGIGDHRSGQFQPNHTGLATVRLALGIELPTSTGTLSSVRTGASVPAPISDRFEEALGLGRSAQPDGQRFGLPEEEAAY